MYIHKYWVSLWISTWAAPEITRIEWNGNALAESLDSNKSSDSTHINVGDVTVRPLIITPLKVLHVYWFMQEHYDTSPLDCLRKLKHEKDNKYYPYCGNSLVNRTVSSHTTSAVSLIAVSFNCCVEISNPTYKLSDIFISTQEFANDLLEGSSHSAVAYNLGIVYQIDRTGQGTFGSDSRHGTSFYLLQAISRPILW